MKLGDIKIEALKLMFTTYDGDIDIQQIPTLESDENYSSYLVAMPGSINRAFSAIEESRVLPIKTQVFSPAEALASGSFARFDLSSVDHFFDIARVSRFRSDICGGQYDSSVAFIREGQTILIPDYDKDSIYTLMYYPCIDRVTADTEDPAEIDIPDRIACIIPYYIKGDLFREEEPNEASEARNWFEASLDQMQYQDNAAVGGVVNVFSVD